MIGGHTAENELWPVYKAKAYALCGNDPTRVIFIDHTEIIRMVYEIEGWDWWGNCRLSTTKD